MPAIKGTASIASDAARNKLLRTTKFPSSYAKVVDLKKVNVSVMTQWIEGEIKKILGFEDDIVSSMAVNLFFPKLSTDDPSSEVKYGTVDPRNVQLDLSGFLGEETAGFVEKVWNMLLDAQEQSNSIPRVLIEAKKAELKAATAQQKKQAPSSVDRPAPSYTRETTPRTDRDNRPDDRYSQSYRSSNDAPSERYHDDYRSSQGRDERNYHHPPRNYDSYYRDSYPPSRRHDDYYSSSGNYNGRDHDYRHRDNYYPKNRNIGYDGISQGDRYFNRDDRSNLNQRQVRRSSELDDFGRVNRRRSRSRSFSSTHRSQTRARSAPSDDSYHRSHRDTYALTRRSSRSYSHSDGRSRSRSSSNSSSISSRSASRERSYRRRRRSRSRSLSRRRSRS